MKFDSFLATIDGWGHYQKPKFIFIWLTYMVPPIMVYTWSFTAATPDFRCHNPSKPGDTYNDASNQLFHRSFQPSKAECEFYHKLISLKECQRCYRKSGPSNSSKIGILETCDSYVFDQSIYKKTLVEEWSMVCDRVGYRSAVQMIYFIGFMCGAIIFGTMADKYGRRPVMSISFILMTIGGFLCAFGPQPSFGIGRSYLIFVIARFLLACSTRGISESGFVLGSEMVEPNRRLMIGMIMNYFFTFGEFFLVLMAFIFRSWRSLTLVITLVTLPFCFFYFARWLVSKGRFDEAEKILRRIAMVNKQCFDSDAFERLKETQQKAMNDKTISVGVMSLFRTRIIRFISINLFFQWLTQNLVYYGVSLSTGTWQFDPYLSFALSTFVELLAYVLVHFILNRLGRKIPYCVTAITFGILALLIIPIQALLSNDKSLQRTILFIINIILKFLASISFAIIYLFSTELFPTNLRTTGFGICSMIGRLGAILGTFSNDYLGRIWTNFPVILYGVISLLAGFLALIFPETLNKPLPQTVDEVERMGLPFFSPHNRDSRSNSDNST